MKILKHILAIIILMTSLINTGFAQNERSDNFISVVYLKDGSIFRGDIVKYERGGIMELRIIGGQIIKLNDEEIDHVEQERMDRSPSGQEGEEPLVDKKETASSNDYNRDGYIDVVLLNNNSSFKGKIIEEKEGEYLLLKLSGGDILRLEAHEIKKVTQEQEDGTYSERRSSKVRRTKEEFRAEWKESRSAKRNIYEFKEKGFYNATYFSSTSGEQEGEFNFGLGFHNVFGYQFSRLFGLGLGLGLDTYSFESGETLYPVYLEGRGYFREKINSPYYAVGLGYGFAFENEDEEILEAEGGIMAHPSIGMRFGASADTNLMLDVGVKIQEAKFVREFTFTGEREERNVTFQRITIRLGLIF